MPERTFDVAKNIRMTQQLQCRMLALLSDFFDSMYQNASKTEQTEILAEIALFLMVNRLGISKETLDRKAAMALKAELLKADTDVWKDDLLSVLQMLERT